MSDVSKFVVKVSKERPLSRKEYLFNSRSIAEAALAHLVAELMSGKFVQHDSNNLNRTDRYKRERVTIEFFEVFSNSESEGSESDDTRELLESFSY